LAANPITPAMSIVLPVPGQTLAFGEAPPGQSWMELQNTGTNTIDQHDHSTGKGLQVRPAGLNINADLPFGTNNATGLRSTRFTPISLGSIGVSDVDCLLFSGVDAYIVDGSGNQIRVTSGGALAGTPGSISGLVSPASASYASGPKLFTFDSGTNQVGGIACGPLVLTDSSVTTGKAATLAVPNGLASNYNLTLFSALPGSTKILTVSSAGAIGDAYDVDGTTLAVTSNTIGVATGGIGTTQLASTAVTTAKVANNAITRPLLAAVGQQISSSSGAFSTSSVSPVNVTNLSVSITTTGRPVMLIIQPFLATGSSGMSGATQACGMSILRAGSPVTSWEIQASTASIPSVSFLDTPGAGTYTYQVQGQVTSGGTLSVETCVLVAYEL
jgi:hypothetical protein